MGLAAPLALLGLLAVPLILAFYVLRLRRDERPVSSTYLWQHLVRDVQANAPWQRLRRSLLLLLQLLLAILLAVLVAQPFAERPAGLARDLVLVVDASASMNARDVFPDRLAAAKRAAVDALADLPAGGRVSVISSGETARVLANEATDRGRAVRAIESIEPSTAASDLEDALRLAGKLAQRVRGAEVLVVTDDAGAAAPATCRDGRLPSGEPCPLGADERPLALDVPVRVLTVGRERENQAIVALAVQADPSGLQRLVFVSIANFSDREVTRRLQILADGSPVTARDLALRPFNRTQAVIDELPPGTRVVEARLAPAEEASGAVDHLATDDAAWTIVPEDRLRRILLVGPGNVYIQNAFALLPNVELYGVTPDEWATTTGKDRFDLVVFDGWLPDELPAMPTLAFAPPATSPLGAVAGTRAAPAIGEPAESESLLRGVDLSRLHIAETQRIPLPAWARAVLPGEPDPLVYAGIREGFPTAVFAFDLRHSDLPLQVAWPILVSNLAGELLGLERTSPEPYSPSAPVTLPLSPGAEGLRVTLPDGTVREVPLGTTGASTVTFTETQQLGVYRVEPIVGDVPASSASPSAAAPSPAASPSASGGASPSAATAAASPSASPAAATADRPVLFAVDLFDEAESNIAPNDGSRLTALGAQGSPGPADPTAVARDELWPLLVALALALLMVEWLVYERDGARRIVGRVRGAGFRLPRRWAR